MIHGVSRRRRVGSLALGLLLCLAPGVAARSDDAATTTPGWDLDADFPTEQAWERARDEVHALVEEAQAFRGRVSEGPRALARPLDLAVRARGLAARMARFGLLREVVDTRDARAATQAAAGADLEIEVDAALAFLLDEIAELGPDTLERWIAAEPALARHDVRLRELAHEAGLGPRGTARAALTEGARTQRLTSDLYWSLIEGDLGWLAVADGGDEQRLDAGRYRALRRSPDRALSERASRGFFARLAAYRSTFARLLTGRVESALANARLRGFTHPADYEFAQRDAVPEGVWYAGFGVARQRLPVLRRYLELRARAVAVAEPDFEALWVTPAGAPSDVSIGDAFAAAETVADKLGPAYRARLRDTLARPWRHLANVPHKRAVWGVFWQAGGGNPYLVMPYDGSYRSARTLAAGSMLATSYASIPAGRVPVTRNDPPIYSNAVVYLSDLLVTPAMRERLEDSASRVAVTIELLDRIARHAFFYALVAEFDRVVVERLQAGRPFAPAELSASFLGLLDWFYGGEGGVRVDPRLADLWIVELPNEFHSYEHLAWLPAMAAAAKLAELADAGDSRAGEAVVDVLARSPTFYSRDLLAPIGIDTGDPGLYHALVGRMEKELDRLERELQAR